MIRIKGIRTKIVKELDLVKIASSKLNVSASEIKEVRISKKSIDARNKKLFSYVIDLDVEIDDEDKYLNNYISKVTDESYKAPDSGDTCLNNRPVIIGAGPAGLFCAYELAKYGYKPLIIERGERVEERIKAVNEFWQNNNLNENSNVQFGEGGAGTFSDGKLNTLVKDKEYRMKEAFDIFVENGSPEEILYDSKPHIGTDKLREVIVSLRNKIISMGGNFLYNSLMEDIIINDGKVAGIMVNGELIKTDILVLAIGHSARDTFKLLKEKGFILEPKPFAVGVRIIHPQKLINENQYPINYDFLPPASYKLTYTTKSNRGVYSFCMCPGGYVVNSSSIKGTIVVNGMSNYKRETGSANSAIVVTVSPSDFGKDVFAGINFQENLEKKAYALGKGFIPIQKYSDFKTNTISDISLNDVKGKTYNANINDLFPPFINDALKEGIDHFDRLIPGFKEGFILAPESRTSSPLRIVRGENLESNIKGVYPCGEGSGYAGGITTSAMDGIKVFEEIRKIYKPF